MKKKLLMVIFICIFITFLFLFLQNRKEKYSPSVAGDDSIELSGVDFLANYKKSDNTLSFTIKNNNTFEIEYGEDFYIEIQKDNSWYHVNTEDSWTSISHTLLPNDEIEKSVELSSKLGAGNYRLIKFINIPNNDTNANMIVSYFKVSG